MTGVLALLTALVGMPVFAADLGRARSEPTIPAECSPARAIGSDAKIAARAGF
jgi:hypothetical protein